MTPDTKKRIHLIYGILVGIAAVVAGVCLIAACCNIYFTGVAEDVKQIYTPAIVAESFGKIAIPVYVCLVLVIGGILLNIALPLEAKKSAPEKNLPLILSRLQAKTDLEQCGEIRQDVAQHHSNRKFHTFVSAGLLAIGSVIFLVYACNANHWGTNSTPSMVSAMYMMIGCLAIPCAYTVYTALFCRKSMAAEIELMKQAAKLAPRQAAPVTEKSGNRFLKPGLQVAILVIGAALVILGACNGGTADILTKAVNICTECVGLG